MKDEHGKDVPQAPDQTTSLEPKTAELSDEALDLVAGGRMTLKIQPEYTSWKKASGKVSNEPPPPR